MCRITSCSRQPKLSSLELLWFPFIIYIYIIPFIYDSSFHRSGEHTALLWLTVCCLLLSFQASWLCASAWVMFTSVQMAVLLFLFDGRFALTLALIHDMFTLRLRDQILTFKVVSELEGYVMLLINLVSKCSVLCVRVLFHVLLTNNKEHPSGTPLISCLMWNICSWVHWWGQCFSFFSIESDWLRCFFST